MEFRSTLTVLDRASLDARAAASIRAGIEEGAWSEVLPSERSLCALLQVSRPTIRKAIRQLAQEGLVELRWRRRSRIVKQRLRSPKSRKRLVAIVSHETVYEMSNTFYHAISEMRAHLARRGFISEFLVWPGQRPAGQRRRLELYLKRHRVFCCVLLSPTLELQRWFADRSIPGLILGSRHDSVPLPSLDVNYGLVCRHAAGILLGRGHRRFALIIPNSGYAGDRASEEGFLHAIEDSSSPGDLRATVVRHNGGAKDIGVKLDALFRQPDPPTALVVAKPQHVFVVILYLLKRGLAVPEKVSLIARDQDILFSQVSPPIAHYRLNDDEWTEHVTRLMLKLVRQGSLPAKQTFIFPGFIDGGTVRVLGRAR